jgi:hypothetical protein
MDGLLYVTKLYQLCVYRVQTTNGLTDDHVSCIKLESRKWPWYILRYGAYRILFVINTVYQFVDPSGRAV